MSRYIGTCSSDQITHERIKSLDIDNSIRGTGQIQRSKVRSRPNSSKNKVILKMTRPYYRYSPSYEARGSPEDPWTIITI